MPPSEFRFLGIPHVTAMLLTLLIPITLSILVRKASSENLTRFVCCLLGGTLLTNEIVHWGYRLVTAGFAECLQNYLSLHICGIAVFSISLALFSRNQVLFEIGYFWGLVGTLNAIITPQLEVGYPKYRFFQYFIAHSGIIIAALFATWGLGMRPNVRSVFRAFLIAGGYMMAIAGVNLMLGSNYMFICYPPDTKSPFFFFPWPWYILFLSGITFILFFVVYFPFWMGDMLSRKRRQGEAEASR